MFRAICIFFLPLVICYCQVKKNHDRFTDSSEKKHISTTNSKEGLVIIQLSRLQRDTVKLHGTGQNKSNDLFICKGIKGEYLFWLEELGSIKSLQVQEVIKEYAPAIFTLEKDVETLAFNGLNQTNMNYIVGYALDNELHISKNQNYISFISLEEAINKYVIAPKLPHLLWTDSLKTANLEITDFKDQHFIVSEVSGNWVKLTIVDAEEFMLFDPLEGGNEIQSKIGWIQLRQGKELNFEFYLKLF